MNRTDRLLLVSLNILQRRYASGEIHDEQFQRMRAALQGGVTEPASVEPTDTPSEPST